MASFKEFVHNIKGHLYDRTSSPLALSLLILLIGSNWQAVLILLDGELSGMDKIYHIKYVITESRSYLDITLSIICLFAISILLSGLYNIATLVASVVSTSLETVRNMMIGHIRIKWSKDYVDAERHEEIRKKQDQINESLRDKCREMDSKLSILNSLLKLDSDVQRLFIKMSEEPEHELKFSDLTEDELKIAEDNKGIFTKGIDSIEVSKQYRYKR